MCENGDEIAFKFKHVTSILLCLWRAKDPLDIVEHIEYIDI